MKTQITKCEICKLERPCIQRRDGSWACGPCLQDKWNEAKRKLVYRSRLPGLLKANCKKAATR